jgi:hypothetical protein
LGRQAHFRQKDFAIPFQVADYRFPGDKGAVGAFAAAERDMEVKAGEHQGVRWLYRFVVADGDVGFIFSSGF